jgi:ATP-binding cassette subfamily B protein
MDVLPEDVGLKEPVRLCVESDLRMDGSFGREWLVVTQNQLLVFSENGEGTEKRLDLLLSDVKNPKAKNLVGGGALEIARNGSRLELVRYTNARAPHFASASNVLEKWLKNEEAEFSVEEEARCARCGLPLEKGTKICPVCTPKSQTLKRLFGYMKPYWKSSLALTTVAIVNTALGLIPPYLQKPLIDRVLAPVGTPEPLDTRLWMLGLIVGIFLFVRVLIAIMSVLQGWLSAWLGNHITHDIRTQLYRHLQFMSLGFFDKRQMGSVISRVNQDTGQLQQFLVWGAQDLSINLLLLAGIGAAMFLMNWKLALLVLLPAPLITLFSARFFRRVRVYLRRFFDRWSKVNSVLNESLMGLRVVKAFAQERREINRFHHESHALAVAGTQMERAFATLFSGFTLLIMLGTLFVWYIGGRDVLFGQMTVGTLIAFMTYVAMFYMPMQSLGWLVNWASRSITAAERVFEVLDAQPEVYEAEDAVPMPAMEGRVEFRDVTFGYDRHRPVLKRVSFDVAPGEMIGLVGHSGAGKSTMINLLCRFYDVNEGEILIDGVPIRRIRLEDLRKQIGLVPQDTFLFSGTIAENIAYAKPGVAPDEIIQASKVANAHEFIMQKPDGYETRIGESGQGLSGGEKQRIAIARAVLHNPRILILDEATSHVDVDTEKQIQEAIERLTTGRTTFAIAHRLSTLKNAHRLIVLKNGEIVEIGSHDELMAKEEGEFQRLVKTYQEVSKIKALER